VRVRDSDVEFLIIDCNARNKSHMHMNLCFEARNVQGDQKVSVHLMITIQRVTSNVQNVPRHSPDIIDTRTVFSKTVLSIARSTFRMYSVMAIFNSSTVWEFFVRYTENFWSPCITVLYVLLTYVLL